AGEAVPLAAALDTGAVRSLAGEERGEVEAEADERPWRALGPSLDGAGEPALKTHALGGPAQQVGAAVGHQRAPLGDDLGGDARVVAGARVGHDHPEHRSGRVGAVRAGVLRVRDALVEGVLGALGRAAAAEVALTVDLGVRAAELVRREQRRAGVGPRVLVGRGVPTGVERGLAALMAARVVHDRAAGQDEAGDRNPGSHVQNLPRAARPAASGVTQGARATPGSDASGGSTKRSTAPVTASAAAPIQLTSAAMLSAFKVATWSLVHERVAPQPEARFESSTSL